MQTAAAFLIPARSRVIDEHVPHESRRDAQKVRAVLPAKLTGSGQPQKRFIDEGGDLKGVIASLATHVAAGEPSQLRLDDGDQPIEGRVIAGAPGPEELRNRPG